MELTCPKFSAMKHFYPNYGEKHVWANSVDPDQTQQNETSDRGLHFLPLIEQF